MSKKRTRQFLVARNKEGTVLAIDLSQQTYTFCYPDVKSSIEALRNNEGGSILMGEYRASLMKLVKEYTRIIIG